MVNKAQPSTSTTAMANEAGEGHAEAARLQELEAKRWLPRLVGYLGLSGPGFLQGAMTLGGGSAVASLAVGANFGYEYLWVQPVSMIIGCIMLFALSYQTLSSGERPYVAMQRHLSKTVALLWALAAIASSVIWGLAQYPIGAGMLEDMVRVTTGFEVTTKGSTGHQAYLFGFAVVMYGVVALTAWNYSKGGAFIRGVEKTLKVLIAVIVICFGLVVVGASMKGRIDWVGALAGFIPRSFPTDGAGLTTLMGAFGAAIGINMTFLYGYTLLRRNWGKAHRILSRYDITMGLVIPYIIVVSLISIACASGLYPLAKPLEVQAKLLEVESMSYAMADADARLRVEGLTSEARRLTEEGSSVAERDQKFAQAGRKYRAAEAKLATAQTLILTKAPEARVSEATQQRVDALRKQRADLIRPTAAAKVFESGGLGTVFGRIVFCLGILGMTTNALIMHMLCCGFACAEVVGFPIGSRRYQYACLITTPAVLGVFFWHVYGMYIGLITSAICAFLLPIAYVGWLIMNNKSSYLGAETPTGRRRMLANVAMSLCIVVVVVALAYTTWIKMAAAF